MPADLWNEVARMATCGLLVAAVAVPVGVVAWFTRRAPSVPPPEPWHAPWTAFEVFAAFILLNMVVPVLALQVLVSSGAFAAMPDEPERNTVRMLWASLLALPLQLGLVVATRNLLFPTWRFVEPTREWPRRVALAVLAWAVLTPAVLLVNAGVNWSFAALEWTPREHPLTRLGTHPVVERALFVFQACIAAPVLEELVFRGLLLPWLMVSAVRTGPVLIAAAIFSAGAVLNDPLSLDTLARGPVVFAVVVLLVGAPFVGETSERGKKWGAVFASAAFFAAVHSSVWPTPIPLLGLGLGLGYLAVRTRSVLVPVLVHGLFNAVSAVFVLRGPA